MSARFLVRLAAATALALFGGLHWGGLVEPGAGGAIAAATGLAALVALTPNRLAFRIPACLALVVALLLLAGVPVSALTPAGWGSLFSGLGEGIASVPALRVPYDGSDEWVRTVIVFAAEGLVVLGVLASAWAPRGIWRAVAVLALTGLYLVPAVQLTPDAQYARGALFLALLAALLFGERLVSRPRDIVPATALVVVAAAIGLVLSPGIDGDEPWLDYEQLAADLSERGGTSFDWNHQYGPLDWPRDGRTVLRIKANRSAYWTASHLDGFDGRRWVAGGLFGDAEPDAQLPLTRDPSWTQNIRVALGDMETNQVIGAGTITDLSRLRLIPQSVGSPGSFATSGQLRRGDSYNATVYVPRPKEDQLRAAGTVYPPFANAYRVMRLPAVDRNGRRLNAPAARPPGRGSAGFDGGPPPESQRENPSGGPASEDRGGMPGTRIRPRIRQRDLTGRPPEDPAAGSEVVFPAYGSDDPVRALSFVGRISESGERLMRRSSYDRSWALSRRLLRDTNTPYEYVRAVQRHLARGYRYDELAPRAALPLETFLFDKKVGYCQHFSGAMALLLRMGGVPARVVAGFSPGSLDERRDEYVVRDLDAHSWVEAFFPGVGWVTFDPTPADAPARRPGVADDSALGSLSAGADGPAGDRADDRGAQAAGPVADDAEPSPWPWLAGAAVLLALAGGVIWFVLWRRRSRAAAAGEDPRLAELRRALRRTGSPAAPTLTLRQLEHRLAGAPGAARYVGALRRRRFAGDAGTDPDPRDRAALRAELARAGGPFGRLKALWALPPQPLAGHPSQRPGTRRAGG